MIDVWVEASSIVADHHSQDVGLDADAEGRVVRPGVLDHVVKGLGHDTIQMLFDSGSKVHAPLGASTMIVTCSRAVSAAA